MFKFKTEKIKFYYCIFSQQYGRIFVAIIIFGLILELHYFALTALKINITFKQHNFFPSNSEIV